MLPQRTIRIASLRLLLVTIALVSCALAVLAVPSQADERFAPLADRHIVAIMRHALAPGTSDPTGFRLDDCATQRNLDDRGKAQARAIGNAIRASGVKVDRVLSSQWCRCRETAELLGLGAVEEVPALNSFFEDRSTAADQTRAVRAILADLPAAQTVMIVTHQVNITALTNQGVSSGEVFLLDLSNGVRVKERILIAP